MEKLIEKYNKECNIISKKANRLWKIGQILITFIFSVYSVATKMILVPFFLYSICMTSLYCICEYINMKYIQKKLKIKELIWKKNKYKKTIYQELDLFQRKWITDYCRKNKLNTITKLNIVREEFQEKKKNSIIRYVNPIIIGSLSIPVWEILVQGIAEELGIINAIMASIFIAVIISIFIGWFNKEWEEQKEFFKSFERYSGIDRLRDLLLYVSLKLNK